MPQKAPQTNPTFWKPGVWRSSYYITKITNLIKLSTLNPEIMQIKCDQLNNSIAQGMNYLQNMK